MNAYDDLVRSYPYTRWQDEVGALSREDATEWLERPGLFGWPNKYVLLGTIGLFTLGAAAFLIAEFLKISYLDVIWMATIPTILYYLSLFFMVELDGKRYGVRGEPYVPEHSLGQLSRRYWFHFISLVSIVVFMVWGYSPTTSVLYATGMTMLMSYLTRETALTPKKLVRALADGSLQSLTAATTCATSWIVPPSTTPISSAPRDKAVSSKG